MCLFLRTSSPILSPSPNTNCKASLGSPASNNILINLYAIIEVCSAGLAITVFPVKSAAIICPVNIAIGKFHGLIQKIHLYSHILRYFFHLLVQLKFHPPKIFF